MLASEIHTHFIFREKVKGIQRINDCLNYTDAEI